MGVVNPLLTVDELNTRKFIIKDTTLQSYQIKTGEPLILWRNYSTLQACLTECNYSYYGTGIIHQTFSEFLDKHKYTAIEIRAKFHDNMNVSVDNLYHLREYKIDMVGSGKPVVKMYIKLHDVIQTHPIHGKYVAWTTRWSLNEDYR